MFKVGDKVRAIDNRYNVTNKRNGFIGEVVELIDMQYEDLIVRDLDSLITYEVHSSHFELVEEPTEFTFQEVVARNIPGVYVNCNDDMARVQSIEINEDGDLTINAEFKGLKEINLGLGINRNLKFKLQEPKKMYVLYEVIHAEKGKEYTFRPKEGYEVVPRDWVVCDTKKGKTFGMVIGSVVKQLTEKEYKQYKECWRA